MVTRCAHCPRVTLNLPPLCGRPVLASPWLQPRRRLVGKRSRDASSPCFLTQRGARRRGSATLARGIGWRRQRNGAESTPSCPHSAPLQSCCLFGLSQGSGQAARGRTACPRGLCSDVRLTPQLSQPSRDQPADLKVNGSPAGWPSIPQVTSPRLHAGALEEAAR